MKKWSIYILAVFLLAACTTDEIPVPVPVPIGGGDEGEKETLVKVILPGASAPKTYANITEVQENKIDSLDVLVFNKVMGDELTEPFLYRIKVDPAAITPSGTNEDEKTVRLKLSGLNNNGSIRLVFIANARTAVNGLTLTPGTTKKSDILSSLTYDQTWQNIAQSSFTFTPFPMWGQTRYLTSADTITGAPKPEVNILRAVARIDIGVDINNPDPALGFGKSFKIENVYVLEAKKKGLIYPAGNLSAATVTAPNLYNFTSSDSIMDVTFTYEKTEANQEVMRRRIYVPESNAIAAEANTGATFLIIKALFYKDNNNPPVPTYYRINFKDASKYIPLLRNHLYEVNILGVSSKGYATFDEAKNAKTSNLQTTLTVSDLNIGSTTWHGDDYKLGVTSQQIIVDWMPRNYKIYVETDCNDGWKATVIDTLSQDWLRLRDGNTVKTILSGPKTGNVAVEFRYSVLEANKTNQPREATILVTAGLLSRTIKIRQIIGSNSYIMTSGAPSTILIPVNSANLDGKGRVGLATDLRAVVLWSSYTNSSAITITNSTNLNRNSDITVNTTVSTPGNAVIALVGDGVGFVGGNPVDEIIWSWHIWIPGSDPTTNMKANNGFIFMDRNLGAELPATSSTAADVSTFGMYYQWGRKDPFPGTTTPGYISTSAVFDTTEVTVTENLENAVLNPTRFYTSSKNPTYNWYGTTTAPSNNLWVEISGEKAAYDPCPFGWRVPYYTASQVAFSPWYGFTSNSKNSDTYALSGGINYNASTPTCTENGTRGHVWSATPNSYGATNFSFTNTAGTPVESAYRANGYPVRCVRDKYSIAIPAN